jgi:hypothetical protein
LLQTVLHVKGTQSAPVEGHQLVGVSVTHTAPIFLKVRKKTQRVYMYLFALPF